VEQELLTLSEHLSSPPVFSGFRVTRSLFFICMFCWSLFVLLYFFFWPLCCLFFDIQILIAPLVPSNSSYTFSIPCLPAHLICQRQYPDKNAFTCTGKNLIFKHTIYVAATMMHFTFWLELYVSIHRFNSTVLTLCVGPQAGSCTLPFRSTVKPLTLFIPVSPLTTYINWSKRTKIYNIQRIEGIITKNE
jgi:hypothetical protein